MNFGSYVAGSPGYCALFIARGVGVGLALNTQVHNMVATNGTIVHLNVPRPQGHGIPLFNFKTGPL
jgi:hypothetical protein